jgi:hypothetical protein
MRKCSTAVLTLAMNWATCVLILGCVGAGAGAPPPRWAPGTPIPFSIDRRGENGVDPELVRRAFATWAQASDGALEFREAAGVATLGIRVTFGPNLSKFGEAMPLVSKRTGFIVRADVEILADPPGDALQKKLVVYLTALHEIGHALGLPHTDDFDAIMYRFRDPMDAPRYFLRYRQSLRTAEDIGTNGAPGLFAADRRALKERYGP